MAYKFVRPYIWIFLRKLLGQENAKRKKHIHEQDRCKNQ